MDTCLRFVAALLLVIWFLAMWFPAARGQVHSTSSRGGKTQKQKPQQRVRAHQHLDVTILTATFALTPEMQA